jgi:ABC-type transport system involved in multi-copper enzyme maturation permease subunit
MAAIMILPIAEREARVASRHRHTYRIRQLMTLITLAVTAFKLWFPALLGLPATTGIELLLFVTWITYPLCLITGAALTVDCISQEKRDGTLGLLFLTSLSGYDIVLGKFASAWLNGFYGLVATIPVASVTILAGGVSFAEFSRVSLALAITLFVSLSVGMFVSTVSRNAIRAMTILTLALLVYGFGVSIASELFRVYGPWPEAAAALNLVNTHYLLEMAFDSKAGFSFNRYWLSCSLLLSISCALLLAASWLVPRNWQERPSRRGFARWRAWWHRQKYGAEPARSAFRTRLLEINPVMWLSGRARVSCFGFMILYLTVGLLTVTTTFMDWHLPPHPIGGYLLMGLAWFIAGCLLHLFFLAFLTSFACQWLAEDARSGALELIAATPLSISRILRGQWLSLLRRCAGPMLAIIPLNVLVTCWYLDVSRMETGSALNFRSFVGEGFAVLLQSKTSLSFQQTCGMYFLVACVILPATWVALAWVGMWTALHVRKPVQAPMAALGLVLGTPWILFVVVMGSLEYLRIAHRVPMPEGEAFALGVWAAVALGSNIAFSLRARSHLRKHFRLMAAQRYSEAKIRVNC